MNIFQDEGNSDFPVPAETLPGRRERRRAETHERILRSALLLFAERGYVSTTIEDITNAADVGRGTFFNYFPSKEHLISAFGQMQVGIIRQFVSENSNSHENIDTLLFQLASLLSEEFCHRPALLQSILVAVCSNESVRVQTAGDLEQGLKLVAEFLSPRQQQGELRGDLKPLMLAHQFQRAVFGTMVLWSFAPARPLKASLKEMLSVVLHGIRA
jgi:AcrR family transcriptional regulator